MNTDSLIELYCEVTGKEKTVRLQATLKRQFAEFAAKGITLSLIEEAIRNAGFGYRHYIKDHHTSKPAGNLLKQDAFYFHPHLQIAPPPPMVSFGKGKNFVEHRTEFFLKMKDSFVIEDAVNYFYKRFPYINENMKRDAGAMVYLLNGAVSASVRDTQLEALDLLLFTIDSASAITSDTDRKLTSPLDLDKYIGDGILLYCDKKDACTLAGINRVY